MKSLGSEIPETMLLTHVFSTLPQKFNHFHSAWNSVDETRKNLENLTTRYRDFRKLLKRDKEIVATGSNCGNLYKLDLQVVIPKECYI